MSLINSDVIPASATGGYTIDQSLRFNDDDSAYLSRTPSSAGNRKTWTWSAWFKRANSNSTHMLFFTAIESDLTEDDHFGIRMDSGSSSNIILTWGDGNIAVTDAIFRDPSAWMHIVVAIDTTQATATDRVKVYINGTQQTFSSTDLPSQNWEYGINKAQEHNLGSRTVYGSASDNYWDGYMAEVHFIDGQALDPTSFGETGDYGEWKPIEYTGSYGTNGFYLDFDGTYYNDKSGNGNNWTANNLATTDVVPDSPTNNFSTLNPIDNWVGDASTLSQGNLYAEDNSGITVNFSTMSMRTGKWYWEILCTNSWFGGSDEYGIIDPELCYTNTSGSTPADIGTGAYIFYGGGAKKINGTYTGGLGVSIGTNDILSFAFDADTGTLTIYKNGGSGLELTSSIPTGKDYKVSISNSHPTYELDYVINFGQDSSFAGNKTAQGNQDGNSIGDFYYTPPSGYLALCTSNLSDPAVIPAENFKAKTYTGAGNGTAITGVGFQPDWGWFANRSGDHKPIYDVLRGTNRVYSNLTGVESSGSFVSFDSDGFTVNADGEIGDSGGSYVSWLWKAGGSGVSNTNGSITSTVSANPDAGFSIVTHTGTGSNETVGHGLSSAPQLIMTKSRNAVGGWIVMYDIVDGSMDYMQLNSSGGASSISYNNPTNQVYTYNDNSGNTQISYCFHNVDGFSKMGRYTGNGSSDGVFVHTGFRPAWVMIKEYGLGYSWCIYDNDRDNDNPLVVSLLADGTAAERDAAYQDERIDFLSNGFKLRGGSSFVNNTMNYIYLAFAEHPFKYTNAR